VILEAGCWAHARRKSFVLADVELAARRRAQGKSQAVISPLCLEAVHRIDKLFDIERDINRCSAEQRRSVRQELSKPLVADLHSWMIGERRKLSSSNHVAKAMDYMLMRWVVFTRFLVGRPRLPDEQCRRAWPARHSPWPQVMAVRRIRPGQTARRGDVQPDRQRQDERHRPTGLVGPRPRQYRPTPG
jgi:hypothetical protein